MVDRRHRPRPVLTGLVARLHQDFEVLEADEVFEERRLLGSAVPGIPLPAPGWPGAAQVAGFPAVRAPCRTPPALDRDGVAWAAAGGAGLGACGVDRREDPLDPLPAVLICAGGVDVEEQPAVDVVAGKGHGVVDHAEPLRGG